MSQVPPHYAHLAKGGAPPPYTTVLISYTKDTAPPERLRWRCGDSCGGFVRQFGLRPTQGRIYTARRQVTCITFPALR